MPKTAKVRKPTVVAKLKTFIIPSTCRNIPKGVLNTFASGWTSPSQIVDAIDSNIVKTKQAEDIFSMLTDTFTKLQNTSVETSIKTYATKCHEYASEDDFKSEFIDLIEMRKLKLNNLAIEKRIHQYAQQGMNGALDVAESSMSEIVARTLHVVRNGENTSEQDDGYNSGGDPAQEDEESQVATTDERIWKEILSTPRRSAINPPGTSQYTPEKPKLTFNVIKELEPSCCMALSCMPLSKIPTDLLPPYYQNKEDNFNMKSLASEKDVFARISAIVDIPDTDDSRNDFGFSIWTSEKEARTNNEKSTELLRVLCLCLTDFWSVCDQKEFRKDHERTFWVENIVPKFKYLGANSDIVFSWCEDHVKSYQDGQREVDFWLNTTTNHYSDGVGRVDGDKEVLLMESSSSYQTENFEHSLEDTYKLIKSTTSSLYEIIQRRQNCKAESASQIAVYSIQCIKDKLTLMKTTLDSKLERYQIVELRSCNVPTAWKDRLGILRVFELLTCIYHELKDQRELERVLLRQESRMIPVPAIESVRHFLTCARLASNEE